MMERRTFLVTPLGVLAVAATALSQEDYKAVPAAACTLPEVSDAMKRVLQADGLRVENSKGVFCELWLRKTLPQKPGSNSPAYDTVANGTFAGIIRYEGRGGDYRGQAVKPGVYVMRFQTMPVDGNHMGCAPSSDFVLLAPASADKDPDAVIGYDVLLNLSLKASGTAHPIPLYLTVPEGGGTLSFRAADEHHWAVETRTKAKPEGGPEIDFPVAIVLIGKAEA